MYISTIFFIIRLVVWGIWIVPYDWVTAQSPPPALPVAQLAQVTVTSIAAVPTTPTDDDKKCQTDMEWNTHPVLCNVLQRLHTFDDTTGTHDEHVVDAATSITSTDLHQFSTAMGWIVDLRDDKDEPLETTTRHQDIGTPFTTTTATTTTTSRRHLRHSHDPTGTGTAAATAIPVVIAHGMGDSCYNDGMIHITNFISSLLQNVYTVCIPIGSSQSEDTNNGFFLNMNDSIDTFAQQIQADAQLMSAQSFYAIGLSQGNNILRGYIAKYNSILPSVHTFISINGVNAGIGAVPHCIPEQLLLVQQKNPSATTTAAAASSSSSSSLLLSHDVAFTLCDLLMEQASAAAYTTFAQKHSFQANYWRDPRPSEYDTYRTYSQLAVLNNEVLDPSQFNETLKVNWSRTNKFVWIMAQDDRTVWPPQGEQWGAPDPQDPYRHIWNMNETAWYINDSFGLRTAQEQHKNYFESFPGDHLQFTKDDLQRWVETYLL